MPPRRISPMRVPEWMATAHFDSLGTLPGVRDGFRTG